MLSVFPKRSEFACRHLCAILVFDGTNSPCQ